MDTSNLNNSGVGETCDCTYTMCSWLHVEREGFAIQKKITWDKRGNPSLLICSNWLLDYPALTCSITDTFVPAFPTARFQSGRIHPHMVLCLSSVSLLQVVWQHEWGLMCGNLTGTEHSWWSGLCKRDGKKVWWSLFSLRWERRQGEIWFWWRRAGLLLPLLLLLPFVHFWSVKFLGFDPPWQVNETSVAFQKSHFKL